MKRSTLIVLGAVGALVGGVMMGSSSNSDECRKRQEEAAKRGETISCGTRTSSSNSGSRSSSHSGSSSSSGSPLHIGGFGRSGASAGAGT